MKKISTTFCIAGAACFAVAASLSAQTYSLGGDFQDDVIPSTNINGVWSYGFDQTDLTGIVTNPVVFTPYTLHGGAPAGSDAYYTNGPLSIYQSPASGGYGVISHDSDVPNERAIIRWTAPTAGTIYVNGSSWKFLFNLGDGRQQDYFLRVNNGPFLAAGTESDATLSDGNGFILPQNEVYWSASAVVSAGDHLDLIYLRHPGFVQNFNGFTETITYEPAGSPLITSQATNLQLTAGASGNLSVTASGSGLSYQWYHNDKPIPNGNAATLAIANAGITNSGLYYVVASNSINTRTSDIVVVDVQAPASGVHDATGDFSLAINPTPRGWQYSQSLANGGAMVGPKSAEWNSGDFGAGQPGWLGNYMNVQAGFAGVLQNPSSFDAPVGTLVGFGPSSLLWQASASDTNSYLYITGGLWNLHHQGSSGAWTIYKNGAPLTSGTIDDSTGTSAAPKSFATGSGGSEALIVAYRPGDTFRIELDENDYQGIRFTLTTTNVTPDPFITVQPTPQSVPQASTATFTVAASGSAPLTYQWNFNAAPISGATNATLALANVQAANAGSYNVVVTSPNGVRHSVVVTLTISQQPLGTPWDVATDWINNLIPPVNIGPEGAWSYGYSPMTDASTNNYLDPFSFTPYPVWDNSHGFLGGSGQYSYNPSDPESSESMGTYVANHTSSGANFQPTIFRWTAKRPITINAQGTVWTTDGNSRTQQYFVRKNTNGYVYAQGTVNDSIGAGNPLSWSTNGISLNSGDYFDLYVRRTPNDTQSFIDVTEQIVEAPAGTPHISVQPTPANQTVAGGSTVTYTVTATGSGLSYHWTQNGANVGTNGPTLTLSNVGTNQNGAYMVTVSNTTGFTVSDAASLAIDATPPTILSAVRPLLIMNQVAVTFSESLQASGATNAANYTMNNGNSVTGVVINGGLNTVTLTLAKGISNTQTNILTVNSVRDTVGNLVLTNTQATIRVPSDTVRAQDSSTNQLVVIEAEDYNQNLPGGGQTWIFTNTPPYLLPTGANTNYSGTGIMFVPDLAVSYSFNPGDVPANVPELDYLVYFAHAGTYSVWVRGAGDSDAAGGNDSINLGLDGAIAYRINGVFPQSAGYAWGNTPTPTGAALIVPTPGLHVVNAWMREDGFGFDKLLITSNTNYVPSGIGPSESLVVGPTVAAALTGTNLVLTWPGTGILQSSTNVAGPYTNVTGSTSPFNVRPTGPAVFYRVKQ